MSQKFDVQNARKVLELPEHYGMKELYLDDALDRIEELEKALVEKQATYMHHLMYGDGAFYMDAWVDRAREELRVEGVL